MQEIINPEAYEHIEEQEREKAAKKTDGFLSVMIDAFVSLSKTIPAQTAAAIGYYALFSIFPLLLFMVVCLSFFLDMQLIQEELLIFADTFIPGAQDLITENIQNILNNRGITSIAAAISLLWSGSGVFSAVIQNIQRAWPESRLRGFFINRFLAFISVLVIILLAWVVMIFSVLFSLSDILSFFKIDFNFYVKTIIEITTSYILPLILVYFAAFVLYYYIPTAKVDLKAAQIGAVVTSVVWRIFTAIFSIFALSPFNQYDLIYGSVGAIVLMMLYVYCTAFIILFPAHLVASITHYKQKFPARYAPPKPVLPFHYHANQYFYQLAGTPPKPKRKKATLREVLRQLFLTIGKMISPLFRWK